MKKAQIYIYDYIGSEAVNASLIRNQLVEMENQGAEEYEVHINSQGGSVFEGIAIYNQLKQKNCTVYIDGIAGSIASVIAMAGKKIKMFTSSVMQIHNPWMFTEGDSESLAKNAKMLEQVKAAIVEAYVEKTGKSKNEIAEMMDADMLLTAQDCKKQGFCDEVEKLKLVTKNYIGLFVNLFDDEKVNKNKGVSQMNKQLLAFFGLPENATDEQVTAKLTELKTKYNLKNDATIEQLVEAMKTPPASAPETKPETKNEIKDPRVDAILEQLNKDRAENLINQAVADGKILPADKDVYLASAMSNYDQTKSVLDARAKNSTLPNKTKVNKSSGSEENEKPDLVKDAADFFKSHGRVPGKTTAAN